MRVKNVTSQVFKTSFVTVQTRKLLLTFRMLCRPSTIQYRSVLLARKLLPPALLTGLNTGCPTIDVRTFWNRISYVTRGKWKKTAAFDSLAVPQHVDTYRLQISKIAYDLRVFLCFIVEIGGFEIGSKIGPKPPILGKFCGKISNFFRNLSLHLRLLWSNLRYINSFKLS